MNINSIFDTTGLRAVGLELTKIVLSGGMREWEMREWEMREWEMREWEMREWEMREKYITLDSCRDAINRVSTLGI